MRRTHFLSLYIVVLSLFGLSNTSKADDFRILQIAINSSSYFQSFTTEAINFLQTGRGNFPDFDGSRARGEVGGNNNGYPACDLGGNWYPVDETGLHFVCIDDAQYQYCPSGTAQVYLSQGLFYCHVTGYPDFSRNDGVLEADFLATEGLKWFQRSQAHAGFKFAQALQALQTGNLILMLSLKNEGCGQYNESEVALKTTLLPSTMQPIGFINSALVNSMLSALTATKAVVCP